MVGEAALPDHFISTCQDLAPLPINHLFSEFVHFQDHNLKDDLAIGFLQTRAERLSRNMLFRGIDSLRMPSHTELF